MSSTWAPTADTGEPPPMALPKRVRSAVTPKAAMTGSMGSALAVP